MTVDSWQCELGEYVLRYNTSDRSTRGFCCVISPMVRISRRLPCLVVPQRLKLLLTHLGGHQWATCFCNSEIIG